MTRIPEHGLPETELFARLESFRVADVPWREGRVWSYVYDPGPAARAVLERAFTLYLTENGIDPSVFPSALRLENEIVGMAVAHLGGDARVVGNFTSGGTESILLALKTARDRARALRPGLERPNVVLPSTAHPAFQKACLYLDLRPVLVPVDAASFRADVGAMRAAIDESTVLVVGSAPSYAHGVIDPIAELGRLARERDLLFHVDACIGGFLLPYLRRLGAGVPDFDFSVPGVTSISMDLHKYAFAAKGASVVLYRNDEIRRHQLFACSTWPGYTILNATMQSSKSVGPLAAAWAILSYVGDDGYLALARAVLDGTRRLLDGLRALPGARVLGEPAMNLVAFTVAGACPFRIADALRARDWFVQTQLSYASSPANLHLAVSPANVPHVDGLLADLREIVAMEAGRARTAALAPEHAAAEPSPLPDVRALERLAEETAASGPAGLAETAAINAILDRLDARDRDRVLLAYFNAAYRPEPPAPPPPARPPRPRPSRRPAPTEPEGRGLERDTPPAK